MTSKRTKLRRMTGGLRMRSRDRLIRLRETKLRPMGIGGYRSLSVIPLMVALVMLAAWLRAPQTAAESYRPLETEALDPLSGWAIRADSRDQAGALDTSLVYAEVTWAELEPEEGQFAFDAFEERNSLAEWWAEGKRMILRFIADAPGEEGHMDIPRWLYEALGGEGFAGQFYETSSGAGFAPDYSNVLLREAHRRVILALAERYNGHPGVAYIEIGSLGWEGEWMVDLTQEEANELPTSTISREYAWHYTSAFTDTLMLMRRPYKEVQLLQVGLYNPQLGDFEATWDYLDVIRSGGYDTQIETDLLGMPEFYTLSPSGAHIPARLDLERLLTVDKEELTRQIVESRLSYAVIEGDISSLSGEAMESLREIEPLLGYRLWVRSAEWDCRVRSGVRSKVILCLRNDGVAPLHAGWPVELALFDGEKLVCSQRTGLDSSMLQPGDTELMGWIDVPDAVRPGAYTLKLAIVDPATGEPGVYLTMDECNPDTLWTELGGIEII